MSDKSPKTLGQAIDEIVSALQSIDGKSRLTAIRAACEVLEITLTSTNNVSTTTQAPSDQQVQTQTDNSIQSSQTQGAIDIRTLKEKKQPANAQEMACLVAYYLQELAPGNDRKNEIGLDDLNKYFKQAEFPLSKRMVQILVNAKASGYFDSVSKGAYKLNPVGYNLAAHGLPRKTTSK